MPSVVDLCNLALSHLGDRATVASIDPPEGSAQAEHCQRFYPGARDQALQEYAWTFSTVRRSLAQMPSPVPGWAYAYALPADALDVYQVLQAGEQPQGMFFPLGWQRIGFDIETDDLTGLPLVLTNVDQAVIRFSRRITDTSRFSPLFCDALSWLLASQLAGPVLKGDAGRKAAISCYQTYTGQLSRAATKDANQTSGKQSFVPSSVAARGFTSDLTFELSDGGRTEDWTAYPDGLPKL